MMQVKHGHIEVAFPAYYSHGRLKDYAFSEPIAESPLGFYKHKELRLHYNSLRDLKSYKMGIVTGYVKTPEFDAADYLMKETAISDELNLKKLFRRQVDLIVIDQITAKYILMTSFTQGADYLEFLAPALEVKRLHLAFSKSVSGYEEKLADFNRGLETLRDDGTLLRIIKEYGLEQ